MIFHAKLFVVQNLSTPDPGQQQWVSYCTSCASYCGHCSLCKIAKGSFLLYFELLPYFQLWFDLCTNIN